MAFTRIRTIKGRQYASVVESYRVPGVKNPRQRVVKNLGPVGGRKKKKAKIDWLGSLVGGGFALGAHVLKHGTGSPRYRNNTRESGRTRQMRELQRAEIYRQFGVDTASPQAFRATMALLTQEQMRDMWERQRSIRSAAREERRSAAKERQHQEAVKALRDFEQRAAERASKPQETTVPPAPTTSPEEKAREEYMALREHNQAQYQSYAQMLDEETERWHKSDEQWAAEQAKAASGSPVAAAPEAPSAEAAPAEPSSQSPDDGGETACEP
jgi:hypothetical protein